MTNSDLKVQAKTILDLQEKIKEINDIVVPPFPKKPIACKSEEWNTYISNKNEYDLCVKRKGGELDELKMKLEVRKKEMIALLPASNVWFISDDEKIAVGHRSNDWPSSIGDILIVENPVIEDLKEIHHQIVN